MALAVYRAPAAVAFGDARADLLAALPLCRLEPVDAHSRDQGLASLQGIAAQAGAHTGSDAVSSPASPVRARVSGLGVPPAAGMT